jgi:glutamyl-tRNA synthetase
MGFGMINNVQIAKLLYPTLKHKRLYFENKYKKRAMTEGKIVTRFAPNTSGNFHIGFLYIAYVALCAARYSDGICFLRIDDTDKKRENTKAVESIGQTLEKLGIHFQEGFGVGGNYGPYVQSERKEIYVAFVYDLLFKGYAYPCFCTQDDIDINTKKQLSLKKNIGYYGKWAKCRNLSYNEINENIHNNMPYVIRLRSLGNRKNKVQINDIISGKIVFEENDADVILLKSDGLPTYHFAVVVDDYLMRVTHVVRSSSGLPSTPIQLQLAEYLKINLPKYLHLGALTKIDCNIVRKLSRNKDPEANIESYFELGIPSELLLLYLLSLANGNFYDWYKSINSNDISTFPFSIKACSSKNKHYSIDSLRKIGKEYFHNFSSIEVYSMLYEYTRQYDKKFFKIISDNKQLTVDILDSGRYEKNPRKDISTLADFKDKYSYMYEQLYYVQIDSKVQISIDNVELVNKYILQNYDDTFDKKTWLENVTSFCNENNTSLKEFMSTVRNIIAGRNISIDLYDIMKIISKKNVLKRTVFYRSKLSFQQKYDKIIKKKDINVMKNYEFTNESLRPNNTTENDDPELERLLSDEIIDCLIPDTGYSVEELENKYHKRDIPNGAKVTRVGPSPTGSMHIGGVYAALISERVAHTSNGGVFFLRIEDTDQKREQAGARNMIMNSLHKFGIDYDEGDMEDGTSVGEYGPYTQSERANIYKTYIRKMLKDGLAYPCFMTSDELESLRSQQEKAGARPGYYGEWAVWRNKKEGDVVTELEAKKPFVIRFRSNGNPDNQININDLIHGDVNVPEDNNDVVLLKGDGLPTYHFAHVVDDHIMHTTTITRGNEWLSSTPLHIQIAKSLGFTPFEYGHFSTIQKIDENGSRRKLSKRKDPEANVDYYFSRGYPIEAVKDYLMNLANSGYEIWRADNPDKSYRDYEFSTNKMSSTEGGLLNLAKLDYVSKDFIGELTPGTLADRAIEWSRQYDTRLYTILTNDYEYTKKVFSVERGADTTKTRKDLAHFSQIIDQYGLFFNDYFDDMVFDNDALAKIKSFDRVTIKHVIDDFIGSYDETDDNRTWFDKVKVISERYGYTTNMKQYRKNPANFTGSVIDIANILRAAITKSFQSPDLCDTMKTIGKGNAISRLINFRDEFAFNER